MNEVVWITGATSGIGQACVHPFLERGDRVVAFGRRSERLEELRAALPPEYQTRLAVACGDVTSKAEMDAAISELPGPFQTPTLLLANAGLARGLAKAQEATLSDWDEMLATNVQAVFALVHRVLPAMVAQNRGHIVFVGSVAATHAYLGGNVYGATKAFVAQFAKNLRCDLHGTNVRVTNIEPGMVETEFSTTRFDGDEARAKAVYAGMTPLTAKDVADAIVWTASRPAHVVISSLEMFPVAQTPAGFQVARRT